MEFLMRKRHWCWSQENSLAFSKPRPTCWMSHVFLQLQVNGIFHTPSHIQRIPCIPQEKSHQTPVGPRLSLPLISQPKYLLLYQVWPKICGISEGGGSWNGVGVQQPLKRAESNHNHLVEAPNPKINPIKARGKKKAQIGFILGFASGDASPSPLVEGQLWGEVLMLEFSSVHPQGCFREGSWAALGWGMLWRWGIAGSLSSRSLPPGISSDELIPRAEGLAGILRVWLEIKNKQRRAKNHLFGEHFAGSV